MPELKNRITVEMAGTPHVTVKAIIKSTDDAIEVVNAILRANEMLFDKDIVFDSGEEERASKIGKAA